MPIAQRLKEAVGRDGDDVEVTTFHCPECDHEFGSVQSEERVQCPECLARDVEPVTRH